MKNAINADANNEIFMPMFPSTYSIVCTQPPVLLGGWNLQPNFWKGGLDRTSTFGRGYWERGGGEFFQGSCTLHKKSKLKSEILYG